MHINDQEKSLSKCSPNYTLHGISISVLVPILWKDYIYSPRCLDSETTFKLFIQIFICISMRCPFLASFFYDITGSEPHNIDYRETKQLISFISHLSGSLPPSPADSGVSDVDPSSSSQTSDEESKIHSRLQIHGKIRNKNDVFLVRIFSSIFF